MAAPPPPPTPPPPPPPPGGLSLYENLLDPNDSSSASATISSAPVLYNQADNASAETTVKKAIDPALRFQPIRRPQVKQAKPKPTFPKPTVPKQAVATTTAPASADAAVPAPTPAQPKTTLADWAATEEDEWMYGTVEKRQRGGRKRKKKRHDEEFETNWDDIYDPTRPTNVEEYLHSDEKVQEVRDWKALLYRHRRKRDESDVSDDDENEETRHAPSSECTMIYSFLILTYHQINLLHPHLIHLYHHHLNHPRLQLQPLPQTIQLEVMRLLTRRPFPKDNLPHHLLDLQTRSQYRVLLLDIHNLRIQRMWRQKMNKTTHIPHLQPLVLISLHNPKTILSPGPADQVNPALRIDS
jgi:hypothetical protein